MSTQDQITNLLQTMENLESDLLKDSDQAGRKSQRVTRFIYTLIVMMGVMSLANIYFVNDLTQEVRLVVRNLNEMYVHFGHVSKLMSRMRGTVNNMEQNMLMMPIMGEQMAEMGDDTGRMQRDVGYMSSTITTLDHQIGALNANVWDMSMRFRNVNSSVMHIRQDVNQFDRPLPWPPSN